MHNVLKVYSPEWASTGEMWAWNLGNGFRLIQWYGRDGDYHYALSFSNNSFEKVFTATNTGDGVSDEDIDELDTIIMKKMFKELHEANNRIGESYDNFLAFIKREFPDK